MTCAPVLKLQSDIQRLGQQPIRSKVTPRDERDSASGPAEAKTSSAGLVEQCKPIRGTVSAVGTPPLAPQTAAVGPPVLTVGRLNKKPAKNHCHLFHTPSSLLIAERPAWSINEQIQRAAGAPAVSAVVTTPAPPVTPTDKPAMQGVKIITGQPIIHPQRPDHFYC